MAKPDDFRRTASDVPNAQRLQNLTHFKSAKAQTTSPTFQQLMQIEDSNWSQKQRKNQDREDVGSHHNKKSVLAKVKDKAKKLKYSLSGKKHRDENESRGPSTTPSTSVGREEEAKSRSAPMNGSKHASDSHKQASRDHHREAPISRLQKHDTTSNARESCTSIPQASRVQSDQTTKKSEDECASSSNTNTITKAQSTNQPPPKTTSVVAGDTDPNNQAPATTDVPKVHDLPENGSKFSGLTVSTSKSVTSKANESVEEGEDTKGESHKWDKSVSMKEYLMHKFEPGEDERALSQVITQTISPRRDKVREAMSSFLKNDEPSESTSKLSNSEANSSIVANDTNPDLKSKPTCEKNVSFSPRHSLGTSNASSNLNQTFKSTVASYQNHNLGSSLNQNTSMDSLATSSGQNTNTGLNPSSTCVHPPAKTSSSPLGHGSSANGTQTPAQMNPDATQVHSHTDTNGKRVHSHTDTNQTRVPASGYSREVIEEENRGRILQAN